MTDKVLVNENNCGAFWSGSIGVTVQDDVTHKMIKDACRKPSQDAGYLSINASARRRRPNGTHKLWFRVAKAEGHEVFDSSVTHVFKDALIALGLPWEGMIEVAREHSVIAPPYRKDVTRQPGQRVGETHPRVIIDQDPDLGIMI